MIDGLEARSRKLRRIIAFAAALVAACLYLRCGSSHFCMGGHMAHPLYSLLDYANDAAWVTGFAAAAILLLFTAPIAGIAIAVLGTLLTLSRLVPGSTWRWLSIAPADIWIWFYICEFPALIALVIVTGVGAGWGLRPRFSLRSLALMLLFATGVTALFFRCGYLEITMTIFFAECFAWSLWRDRKELKALAAKRDAGEETQ